MNGLAQIAGGHYRELVVDGRTWRLSRPRLRDLLNLEAAVVASLPDPIQRAAAVAAGVPAEQVSEFWRAAFAAAAAQRRFGMENIEELPAVLRVGAGAFLALQRHHGDEIRSIHAALDWCEKARETYGEALESEVTAAINEMEPTPGVAGGSHENPLQ